MTDASLPPVVITRPLTQAQPLAERLRAAGRDTLVFPLLEILPLEDESKLISSLAGLDAYALVAFVSPNAIDMAFRHLTTWPEGVSIAVMGEGSRAALEAHGITPATTRIISPANRLRTDSQTLLETLDIDALRGKRVLIIRGETGRELLADALRAKGVQVEQLAAYRRVAPGLDHTRRRQLSELVHGDAEWIITSSEALRILLDLVRDLEGASGVVKMQQHRLVVPHVRIAETARSLGFHRIAETGSGDDQLIAALQFRA
ncbi:uroporphyrinogen-III synthase [Noviherbaspirillum sp. Root189]|uniref:uroporphyrinogen-III synthase n=1 Tax=Noviherbaspirillum sp. Root189 TaxID=1736487 RepID=UPI000708D453|nr:uroporphyrinogen-III synthase [Noviherbaspirillum sp. Root189]KRB88983.1 uroporphyrinogen III synthase [Noviherbaspirillum sp. Root189]